MAIWTEIIGRYDGEAVTWGAVAGTGYISPWTPTANGRLRALKLVSAAGVATTLMDAVAFRLTCSKFKPVNQVTVVAYFGGVQTNANNKGINGVQATFEVDQEIQAGVPVIIEAVNITAQAPVTVDVLLVAVLEG